MISVLIAYYKNIPALKLIFEGLKNQTFKNFEVVVAEDDNNEKTKIFIEEIKTSLPFKLKHIHQEKDNGFRKNVMLNKAIAVSEGDIVVFLDGDCIPHKRWLSVYSRNIKEGIALFGRRVMISPKLTKEFLKLSNLRKLNLLNLISSNSTRLKYAIYVPFYKPIKKYGIWGCNWGIYKMHLIEINGFDENYTKAGVGEDVDIEWRLIQHGIKLRSVRQSAIVYHLHHDSHYTDNDVISNLEYLKSKDLTKENYCKNGLDKYINKE